MNPPLSRRSLLETGGALAGFALAPRVAFAQSDRIEGLIGKMTLTEKAGQLSCFGDSIRPPRIPFNPNAVSSNAARQLADIAAGKIGMLFNGIGVSGARRAQKAAWETGRTYSIAILYLADRPVTAWAAASRAIGTRKGEHEM